MPATLEHGGGAATLTRDRLAVEVRLEPLSIEIVRGGARLVGGLRPFWQGGGGSDRLIHLTEGVIREESLDERDPVASASVAGLDPSALRLAGKTEGGRAVAVRVAISGRDRITLEVAPANPAGDGNGRPEVPFRIGASWSSCGTGAESLTGLGARHGEAFDQAGRLVRLGADRRYTGPDCPPDLLEAGGVPQGDYVPAPWLLSSAGWGLWSETWGSGAELDLGAGEHSISQRTAAGPLCLHFLCDTTPAARLRHYLRLTGLPALLPEWAYGHWKSRDVYEHQRDVVDDFEGYQRHRLPLDAIVIDSPWETQYNTWRFNPVQFPDPRGLIARMRAAGVRTVVWVTPWVNLESVDGQRPPDPTSERLHARPAANYADGVGAGHFVREPDGRPWVGRWWMGSGSIVDFTSHRARSWWKAQARRVLEMGVEGIKADDGEGYYVPADVRFADGRRGAEAAWAYGGLYRRTMQEALDESHPGTGVLFGRSGWSGQQATGVTWGGDQVSDFWSLRTLVAATLTAAASGFSNWSHDVGGYLGRRLAERCPPELLLRWAQFGCFTPLMQAHGRFAQEAWTYDARTLNAYRELVLLHERLVPYVRAAAATARRSGLPVIRPLCLTDPADPRGWRIADAYGYGPALWVAPVVEQAARERPVELPRGEWIDPSTGGAVRGGQRVVAAAPADRIPVWVRRGSIVVTYPRENVAEGLGDTPERERPLEATLWGRPRCGRALARLADGTRVRWLAGRWSVEPSGRQVSFAER